MNAERENGWRWMWVSLAVMMIFVCSIASASAGEREASQTKVKALMKAGNWKDAQVLAIRNFETVADDKSGLDLRAAVQCMGKLAKYERFDTLMEFVGEKHAGSAETLLAAAEMLMSAPHHGVLIDNKFIRGTRYYGRGSRGQGEAANVVARDRVRALQLLERANGLLNGGDDVNLKFDVLRAWGQAMQQGRTYRMSWKMQLLTDTKSLPEIERGYQRGGSTRGTAVTPDGDPLFYEVPESYAVARNDGERWRWILHQQVQVKPVSRYLPDAELAGFLHQQFGVRTLQSYRWYYRMIQQDDAGKQQGITQVHTLKDNETIARLANGVKRFTLPESQNFIHLYKQMLERGNTTVGDALVNIYLDRRQYEKAADLLRSLIKGHKDHRDRRKELLLQIVADWAKFEPVAGAFTLDAKSPQRVGLIYRNAKQVTLSLHKVDFQALVDAQWEYLQSNPSKIDWGKIHWHGLLRETVTGRFNKYMGQQVAEKIYPLQPRGGHWDTRAELTLPRVDKAGAYLLRAELAGGKKIYTMIWVDSMVLTSRAVEGGVLYFLADAETGMPVAGADLVFRGYQSVRLKKAKLLRKFDTQTYSFIKKTNADGVVFVKNDKKDEKLRQSINWSVEARSGERRAWMGMNRVWSWHQDDASSYQQSKAFAITSQPVYMPGTTLKGKFWVRNARYDLGNVSSYAGQKFHYVVYDPQGQKVGEAVEVMADDFGGVAVSVDIAEDAKLGRYRVQLLGAHSGQMSFRVEQYKKPEFEVKVDAPKLPVKLGDAFEATIRATYYHGAPVTHAKVKVKVFRHSHNARWFPYGRWDWLYGSGYGWLDIERPWFPGWGHWGCKSPRPFWYDAGYEEPELVLDEEMEIGADGSVKVKVDSALAKLAHGDSDHRYEIRAEVVDASRRTIFSTGSVLAARKPFNVTVYLNRGYALAGERIQATVAAKTLDGRDVKGKGFVVLKKVSFDAEGKLTETEITKMKLVPTPTGFEPIDFKVDKAGQYRLLSVITDEKGRSIEGAVLFSVRGAGGEEGEVRYNDLELIADKREYTPGDTVKLLVNTKRENGVVMVFIRGTKERHIFRLKGHSQVVEIPVKLGDMPNFFVEAMTISGARVHTQVREIIVPPTKRVLHVEVLPNSEKYKPREKGIVKIRVTGIDGEPVQGDCVVTIYDKALEYISGGSNVPDIKSFFWKWRRRISPARWSVSQQTFGGNATKANEQSMRFLGVFGQSLSLRADMFGRDIGVYGDGGQAGGMRRSSMAKSAAMSAPMSEMADGESEGSEKEAAAEVMVRSDFADLIKWAGSVKLNADGVGEVAVDFPDNLTTWKIKTWAVAHGTRVGEGSAEVITSKDLIIRLQAPRFFVEKDEVVLSAVVHNYHPDAKQAEVQLELEGGTLEVIKGELKQSVELAAESGEKRVNWRVKVTGEGLAIIRMKVLTDGDSDAMEMKFPVYVHGMLKQMAWSREIAPGEASTQIVVEVPEQRRPEDSRLEVRYSPTIAGAIVDALPYLVEYPYGCTEQTLNRFVPTVITQKILLDMGVDLEAVRNKRANLNPQELGDDRERAKQWKHWQRNPVFSAKEVKKMVRQGVDKLIEMQLSNGGWGWFSGYGEHAYPHTTAVVVHGLRLAQKNGANVPEARIKLGVAWLNRYEARETEKIRMWNKRKRNTKYRADNVDVFVRLVLAENGVINKEMLGYQFRDKNKLSLYAKSMLGMSLHLAKDTDRRDQVIRNIEQFLHYDKENQSAYLEMGNSGYWWYWYGSEIETHAWYLKLLAATKPQSKQARGIVKYLVNNRKHGTYWNSTRDTAYCIEAIAAYMQASGESDPNAEVEVLVDGKSYKKVKITKENLFSYDNKMTLAGDILTTGKHTVEIRRTGKGALYTNAYLTVFTKQDHIKKAGLEVKVERRFYKLVQQKKASSKVSGSHGQVMDQKVEKYDRIALKPGDIVKSGDIIEVELIIESKNDYEYLMFSDFKAAGTEAEAVRSGYVNTGSMRAYMEVRNEKICFFVRALSRGKHSLTYRLRAEIPGKFSALPATAAAMYAPELKANSDEMKLQIISEE